ncbi:MAG: divergent polysaccharide deacetylase family protein [Treponema berlinense]|uniref:divergent polysaccharide deacetylase family protein n=1 Tax=Treponema berlinense TaxID=225004 RepID=UPI002A7EAB09|nr:divergent polysaccharide deacetylase family protein [Treponema berlinense]MDY3707135.1 divergent polysaccharide deacetylase family protein [Treponema berlinense]
MKTQKNSNSPSKKTKRTSMRRRKVKKVKLDKNKVTLLCGIIFLICCVCIAVNVLSQSAKSKNIAEIAKSEKKTEQRQQNSGELGKTQKKKEVSDSKELKKSADSAKKDENSKNVNKTSQKQSADSKKNPAKSIENTNKIQTENKNIQKTKPEIENKSKTVENLEKSKKNEQIQNKEKKQDLPFLIPPAQNGATLVFVIDDAGMNAEYTKRYASLPFPLTIAVLPKLLHSKDCAYIVRSSGKELILHQPMQSLNHNLDPGPGKISVDMSFSQISSIINENLAEIGPGVKGLNNHEGSEVTEDVLRIGAVLDVCLENKIYFLDSRTTANTKAPQAALERDMTIFEKSGPYIDNIVSREAMLKEIYKSLEAANKNGSSIVIAHVDKSAEILPKLLEQMYPYLLKAGYRFATPSTLR